MSPMNTILRRAAGIAAALALLSATETHVHVHKTDDESSDDSEQDPLQVVETFPH